MKCESCGNELTGGAIICRVCNHNNALRGVNQPRPGHHAQANPPRRAGDTQPNAARTTAPLTELPRIVPRKDSDDNVIRFPVAPNKPPANPPPAPRPQASTESEPDEYPPWRAELKERVRQIREKRSGELTPIPAAADEPDEAELDPNPIVESALKRIRWANHPPAITSKIGAGRPGARAAAVAKLTQAEPETETETRTEPLPQPPVMRVETRTLTPKINRDAAAKPQPKPSPESKVLTPRAKPQTTAEPRTGPRPAQRQSATAAVKPDKHVETQIIEFAMLPEPPPLPETEPASLWTRTLAGACDFEIIASAYLPVFGAYATLDTSLGGESLFIMAVLLSAITFVYQSVMLMIAGRTTGMALLDLNLFNTDDDSLPVTRRQKMLRAWAATIVFLLPPLNYLVTRLNLFQRSLPDLISGTTVAKE
jgi:uncharacterized RDD family membrane protein YckC